MKIVSYNVNGIRSALSKGLITWMEAVDADIVCFQEIKAEPHQIEAGIFEHFGYSAYWHPAQKKGYSGVAILSKVAPKNVVIGCGFDKYDFEGRVIRLDFDTFSIMNVYMPSGTSGDERQAFKYEWMDDFYGYINDLKKEIPNLIICGDYNICHQPIDIHNPISNAKSSGFLPEERVWLGKFIDNGFIDTFRYFNPSPGNYTWWSYRFNCREKNLGWRIDYHMATNELKDRLVRSVILPEAKHSDHCPILLEIKA